MTGQSQATTGLTKPRALTHPPVPQLLEPRPGCIKRTKPWACSSLQKGKWSLSKASPAQGGSRDIGGLGRAVMESIGDRLWSPRFPEIPILLPVFFTQQSMGSGNYFWFQKIEIRDAEIP